MKQALQHILIIMLLATAALSAVAQQAAVTQITGLVRDSVTREGIPLASISLIGTNEGTLATEQGGFTINSRARFSQLRECRAHRPCAHQCRVGRGHRPQGQGTLL